MNRQTSVALTAYTGASLASVVFIAFYAAGFLLSSLSAFIVCMLIGAALIVRLLTTQKAISFVDKTLILLVCAVALGSLNGIYKEGWMAVGVILLSSILLVCAAILGWRTLAASK